MFKFKLLKVRKLGDMTFKTLKKFQIKPTMPGKVKVKIMSGRNLPVMDRSSDTTDAYVEIKLGNTTYKTDVCRKSLHPTWNSEWYRFEARTKFFVFFSHIKTCFLA